MTYPAQPPNAVKFIPTNRQEHDNQMRALVGKHMGGDFSNPSQWVVNAVHKAYQTGFDVGFAAGQRAAAQRESAPAPAQITQAPKRLTGGDVIDI